MKRRDFLKAAGLGMLGVATAGFPRTLMSAEKYRFKFATYEPAHSLNSKSHWLWWCDRVEQLSAGSVKFDRFPGEALVKASELYEACRDNIVQAANFAPLMKPG